MRKIILVIDEYQELVQLENCLRRVGFDVLSLGKDILVNDALLKFPPDIVIATAKGRNVDGVKVAQRMKKQSPPPRVALTYVAGQPPQLDRTAQENVDALLAIPLDATMVIRVVSQLAGLDSAPLLEKWQKISSHRIEAIPSLHVTGEAGIAGPLESMFVRGEPPPTGSSPLPAPSRETSQPSRGVPAPSKPPVASLMEDDPWAKAELEWNPKDHRGQSATLRSSRSDRYAKFLAEQGPEDVSGTMARDQAQAAMKKLKAASEEDREKLARIDAEKRAFVSALYEKGEAEASPSSRPSARSSTRLSIKK